MTSLVYPRRTRTAFALLLFSGIMGCSSSQPPTVRQTAIERETVPLNLSLLWARGGAVEDSILFNPWVVRVVAEEAVVLDPSGYRVRAFDPRNGDLLWSVGRKGEGPMEFLEPLDVFVDGGGWGVWDASTGRLTRLERGGRLKSEQLIPTDLSPTKFCPLEDGRLAVLTSSPDAAAALVGPDGAVVEPAHAPFPGLGRGSLPIQRDAIWATDGAGTCVAALTLSSGWAQFGAQGFGPPRVNTEAIEPPEVAVSESRGYKSVALEDPSFATADGFVHDGELWLLFRGETENSGRLIDVHDVETGAYLRSHVLPFERANAIARLDDILYFLRTVEGYPVLEAYQIAEDA